VHARVASYVEEDLLLLLLFYFERRSGNTIKAITPVHASLLPIERQGKRSSTVKF
jgi:hypothetical protein